MTESPIAQLGSRSVRRLASEPCCRFARVAELTQAAAGADHSQIRSPCVAQASNPQMPINAFHLPSPSLIFLNSTPIAMTAPPLALHDHYSAAPGGDTQTRLAATRFSRELRLQIRILKSAITHNDTNTCATHKPRDKFRGIKLRMPLRWDHVHKICAKK